MPFLQRVIEPVHVCRNTLPLDEQGTLAVDVPNELECVTNGTLANIIRQLSSLSKHAEDLFSSLFRESSSIVARATSLQGRIDRLAVKVTQLDSTVEEVSLHDIHMRKAFKSYIVYEQQVVSRESMPAAMREKYFMCDKPPPLDKLNPYREDGKDGLKFYTDPNYFFDLWKQEMLKDTEKIIHDRGKKVSHSKEGAENPNQRVKPECKKHRKNRQPHTSKEKYKQNISSAKETKPSNYNYYYSGVPIGNNQIQPDAQPIRPNSLELHSPYFNQQQAPYSDSSKPQYPPPPPAYTEHPISPQQHYPPPPYAASTPERQVSSPSGTPTRNIYRINSLRPSQPPPAPPALSSASSSGSSTPTVSVGTPSSGTGRYRNNSQRDNLPPPPPPPVSTTTESPLHNSVKRKESQTSSDLIMSPLHSHEEKPQGNGNMEKKNNSPKNLSPGSNNSGSGSKSSLDKTMEEKSNEEVDLPPPPPLPPSIPNEEPKEKASTSPKSESLPREEPVSHPPPPPPPPLPPLEDLVLDIAENGSISENQNMEVVSITSESASETSSVSKFSEHFNSKSKFSGQNDGRSDLLQAIREGIKLRRVEDHKQKEVEKAAPLHDVASILARRVAMEFSDSDSQSGSEYDSDGWEEDAEHAKT